jgi:hypothetical protein
MQEVAEGRGLELGEAASQVAAELERPFVRLKEEAARRRWAEHDRAVDELDTPEGYRRIQDYARRHNVALDEAWLALAPECPKMVRPEESTVVTLAEDEADLDRQAQALAARDDLSYPDALDRIVRGL